MPKSLLLDHSKCHGCRACITFCAAWHEGVACNFVIPWDLEGWGVSLVCQHCEKPACMSVCPQDAIYRDPELNRILVEHDLCTGCRMCISACPLGGVKFDELNHRIIKCDLCDGQPICAQVCSYGAIKYIDMEDNIPDIAHLIRKMVMGERFAKKPGKGGEDKKSAGIGI